MTEKARTASETVWIVKEWYVRPFAWMLAGRNYVHGIDELISRVIDPVLRDGRRLMKLHVLSHGNAWIDPATGEATGHYINLGENDWLDTRDFRLDGDPEPGTGTEKLLRKLRQVMGRGGKLVFSACGQGDGALLRSVSAYIGNDVEVRGYRGLGHPFGSGNLAFRNGLA